MKNQTPCVSRYKNPDAHIKKLESRIKYLTDYTEQLEGQMGDFEFEWEEPQVIRVKLDESTELANMMPGHRVKFNGIVDKVERDMKGGMITFGIIDCLSKHAKH